VRYDAAHVEIGYVVPLQYGTNIFWIFKTAISRNCGTGMATCGMSDVYKACGDSGTVNLKGNGGSDSEVQPTNKVGSYWLLKRE
jgi:hypothetical protein